MMIPTKPTETDTATDNKEDNENDIELLQSIYENIRKGRKWIVLYDSDKRIVGGYWQ